MREEAISQSSSSKALRMFCQSRFLFFFSFLCTSFFFVLENSLSHDTPSLPPLSPPLTCLDQIAPPLLVVVCWTCRHARCTVRPRHQRRYTTTQTCLCLWFFSRVTNQQTVQSRLSSGLKNKKKQKHNSPGFSFILEVRISVCHSFFFPLGLLYGKRNSLLKQPLLHFDCIASSSEHCLSQNSFLSSDIKEFLWRTFTSTSKFHK